jgi:hypothetical protein
MAATTPRAPALDGVDAKAEYRSVPTEDSLSDDHPEHVGWERDAQDEAEAEETDRIAADPASATSQTMRRSLPLGRFLLLLVALLIAVPLIVYFIFGR